MEISGIVFRQVPCFSGAGIDTHSYSNSSLPGLSVGAGAGVSGKLRFVVSQDCAANVGPRKLSGVMNSVFCDNGHMQYYYGTPRCGGKKKEKDSAVVTTKKKLKLLKGMSKDLSMFSQMGYGLDPDTGLVGEVQGKIVSEAAEVLLKQLQQVRAEEKELKKKRKQEKAKLRASRMKTMIDLESSSSSSAESSNSKYEEVIDMSSHLRNDALAQPMQGELPILPTQAENKTEVNGFVDRALQNLEEEWSTRPSTNCSNVSSVSCKDGTSSISRGSTRRIEVCMGNKCKKSGAAALLEEFERVLGVEGAAVGCKCIGKCRDGPNVKVLNCVEEGIDDSVRTPANPLCIGVGLEDVGVIVDNFFGGGRKGLGLSPAS